MGSFAGMESLRQKTDVHYRCMDGVALFNWRFVFDFNLIPQEMKAGIYSINIKIYIKQYFVYVSGNKLNI